VAPPLVTARLGCAAALVSVQWWFFHPFRILFFRFHVLRLFSGSVSTSNLLSVLGGFGCALVVFMKVLCGGGGESDVVVVVMVRQWR